MKVTLRKAHRLVKELSSKTSIRFEYKDIHHTATEDEIVAVIKEVNSANVKAVENALLVHQAISEIRALLQAANSRDVDGNSVDSLLTSKVLIESQMRVLSSFREKSKNTDDEVTSKVLRSVSDNHTSTSEYRDTYTRVGGSTSAVMHDVFNNEYVRLKKEQESVSDKLAYINNKLEIEIDDKFSDLFKELQVL